MERIERLASSVSELRGTIRGAAWGLGLFAALLIAVLAYAGGQISAVRDDVRVGEQRLDARMDRLDARMDGIDRKLDALPAELRGIADSITSAITATGSTQQPPVIVIERPAAPAAPTPPAE